MWDYTKESIRKIYWNTSPLKTQLEILKEHYPIGSIFQYNTSVIVGKHDNILCTIVDYVKTKDIEGNVWYNLSVNRVESIIETPYERNHYASHICMFEPTKEFLRSKQLNKVLK